MKLKNKILNVFFWIILLIYSYFLYINFWYKENGIMSYFLLIIILPSIIWVYLFLLILINKKYKILLFFVIAVMVWIISFIWYEKWEVKQSKLKYENYIDSKKTL